MSEWQMPADVEEQLIHKIANRTRFELDLQAQSDRRIEEARQGESCVACGMPIGLSGLTGSDTEGPGEGKPHPGQREPPEGYLQILPEFETRILQLAREKRLELERRQRTRRRNAAKKRQKQGLKPQQGHGRGVGGVGVGVSVAAVAAPVGDRGGAAPGDLLADSDGQQVLGEAVEVESLAEKVQKKQRASATQARVRARTQARRVPIIAP
jgi:hypothetical protein